MPITVEGGDKLQKFLDDAVKHLKKLPPVEIGFFSTAKYPDGTSVPEVAATHEFGDPFNEMNGRIAPIPPRPFFRPAMAKLAKSIPNLVKGLAEQSLMKDKSPKDFAELVPEFIGARGAALIQVEIARLTAPPLSETTLMIRRTRHVNRTFSEKPLIDTGTMRIAATWAVGKKPPSKKDPNKVR